MVLREIGEHGVLVLGGWPGLIKGKKMTADGARSCLRKVGRTASKSAEIAMGLLVLRVLSRVPPHSLPCFIFLHSTLSKYHTISLFISGRSSPLELTPREGAFPE